MIDWTSHSGRVRLILADTLELEDDAFSWAGPVDGIVTDPPYGVDYAGGHFHSGDVNIVRPRERLHADTDDVYPDLAKLARRIMTHGPIYVFFAILRADVVLGALREQRLEPRAIIIWHKTNATYAAMKSHYKHRFEPIVYAALERALWTGPSHEATLWEGPRVPECVNHPTEKPVWISKRILRNHSSSHWCDPFMGGGSSAVAAAELIREGLDIHFTGVEISPQYWRTAIRRVQATEAQGALL